MNNRGSIGFDRRIRLEWLDAVAGMVASGASSEQVLRDLNTLLASDACISGRKKDISVLCHVWSSLPKECLGLRDRALVAMATVPAPERVAIHWAMCAATYPFFIDVARAVGRLVGLQGEVTLSAVVRRITEMRGQRSTVKRSTRVVIRSMIQWGVLLDSTRRGVYLPVPKKLPVGQMVGDQLIHAMLINNAFRPIPIGQIHTDPALFPFELVVSSGHLRSSSLFQVHRQGLDMDLVELA